MIIDLTSIGGVLLSFAVFVLIIFIAVKGFSQNSKLHGKEKGGSSFSGSSSSSSGGDTTK